jgi:hypothetical protein
MAEWKKEGKKKLIRNKPVFLGLGIKCMALYILGKQSTTELHPWPRY